MKPIRETDKLLAANLLATATLFKNYNYDSHRRNARLVATKLSRLELLPLPERRPRT